MFLTLEDPRAKVQGSRDPLGIQPIWSRFGREVVTNLTSVTRAVRGFAVVLLARYYSERLIEQGIAYEEDAVPMFLRLEQIAAYARYSRDEDSQQDIVLGVTRVARFLREHSMKVPICNDATGFILSDQKTYGLWGLYSVSARASGLLAPGPVGLTTEAREFVEQTYVPKLRSVQAKLEKLILKDGVLNAVKGQQPYTAMLKLLTGPLTEGEREFFAQTLRDARGQDVSSDPLDKARRERQRQLAELIPECCREDRSVTRTDVFSLMEAAHSRGYDALTERLRRILRLESLLVPIEAIFERLQAKSGQRINDVAKQIQDDWRDDVPGLNDPLDSLLPDIRSSVDDEQTKCVIECDEALRTGQYRNAIETILRWNEVVMSGRGSAPWVKSVGGKLDVRFRGLEVAFPKRDELPDLWRNGYFLDSLREVTFQTEVSPDA